MQDILFPYERIRPEQNKLIEDVQKTLEEQKNLLAHAPTGLGKTIAVLGPTLKYAVDNKKTVFFLTSRHTQHTLAIKTIEDINKKFNIKIKVCDMISKQNLCAQQNAENIPRAEFHEYCKALREDKLCEFYEHTKHKGNPSPKATQLINILNNQMPVDTEQINTFSKNDKLCPYEIATLLGKEADIIIGDYNYLFDFGVRESFLRRTGKKIEDSIIIIDEGHNLPSRCREMLSLQLSTIQLQRAMKEAEKYEYIELKDHLEDILKILKELGKDMENNEDFVFKNELLKKIKDVDILIEKMQKAAIFIREQQRQSFVGSVAFFLEMWQGPDNGFCRTINRYDSKQGTIYQLKYRCLDPSIATKDIVNNSVSTILMSGTLFPTAMYADILGFRNYDIKEYDNPFSKENRQTLVIEEVTTKFTHRNEEQYRKIASILADITNAVPGNTFVFFPSYQFRDTVERFYEKQSKKSIFPEIQGMNKEEKKIFIEKFKKQKDQGAVMLGVAQGSFGEGVDLPGDLLKCVVVVGIPLQKPDLETKELIEYYEDKYGQGMNYGYIYPAITRTMQNAGRCIRTEKDRGIIVLMDQRYTWENYANCLPPEWNTRLTKTWTDRISKFFTS
ncbi:ATP-dependent DNA helicase [Candidatus Woesearchaeota archaeon]|nr:ATP-dependent DNA helicase [Candidatus Woesearchaeota archaeon]